jgi:hypothetical protein
MVLEDTSERRILTVKEEEMTICYQTDIELGLYILRGDVVVLMGEVEDEEEDVGGRIRFVTMEEFERIEEEEEKRREERGEVVEEIDWDFDLDLVA